MAAAGQGGSGGTVEAEAKGPTRRELLDEVADAKSRLDKAGEEVADWKKEYKEAKTKENKDFAKEQLRAATKHRDQAAAALEVRRTALDDYDKRQEAAAAKGIPTPLRQVAGISDSASPNTARAQGVAFAVRFEALESKVDAQQARIEVLEREKLYTTRNEEDVGTTIMKNTAKGELDRYKLPETKDVSDPGTVSALLLEPDQNFPGKNEDKQVNVPLSRVLPSFVSHPTSILLCANRSKLIDLVGREQRADIIVSNTPEEVWPNVITMVVGKIDLNTTHLKQALGQCMRRATAILDMQPWRDFVIIPFSCLSQVGFFRLDRTCRPKYSGPIDFLHNVDGQDYAECGRIGCGHLADLLQNPALLGYVPCPVVLDLQATEELKNYRACGVISARSQDKALFWLSSDEGKCAVLKAFRKKKSADRVLQHLRRLGDVRGTVKLVIDHVVGVCMTDRDKVKATWYGLITAPYARLLTSSVATPALVGQCARAIVECAKQGVHHNDIAPDNIVVSDDFNSAYLCDWDIATEKDEKICGFSGKRLFAANAVFAAAQSLKEAMQKIKQKVGLRGHDLEEAVSKAKAEHSQPGSTLNDLESLYYVAVCLADGEASWARRLVEKGEDAMLRERRRVSRLRAARRDKRTERFPEDWDAYLTRIQHAFENGADSDRESRVLQAFEDTGER